jgi:hypothetical protein
MLKVRFCCAAAHENAAAILRRRKICGGGSALHTTVAFDCTAVLPDSSAQSQRTLKIQ